MSQNYNLNNNFGFNIIKKEGANQASIQQAVQNINQTATDLFDNITGYVAKYENVFNGEVEEETNMYMRQSMMIGMNMRAEDNKRPNFDMNI